MTSLVESIARIVVGVMLGIVFLAFFGWAILLGYLVSG